MSRPLRIVYFSGPVDALAVHRRWAEGRTDERHFATIYLRQFLDVVRHLGAEAWVHSARAASGTVRDDANRVRLAYRPVPWQHAGRPAYVAGRILAGVRIVATALRRRADVVVVTEAHTFWFVLAPLRLLGVRVVASVHCVLWLRHRPIGAFRRAVNRLDGWFFAHCCEAVLVVSDEIGRQVRRIAGPGAPVVRFVPSYPADAFAGVPGPDPTGRPFDVVFAGRIAADKGVHLLVTVAERLAAKGRRDIVVHLCGDGPALGAVRDRVAAAGLGDRVVCHGFLEQDRLRAMYGRSHAVVAPTTSGFVEGFNKVVLEGVLAGRPVVTSAVCPALDDVREAVVEVPVDDVDAYRAAIEALCDDPDLYAARREGAARVRRRFERDDRTWEAGLLGVLSSHAPVAPPAPRRARRPGPPPVFVVGAERSGSTLLRLMLAGHPDIAVAGQFEYAVDLLGDDGTRPRLADLRDHLALDRVFAMSGLRVDPDLDHDDLLDDLLRQCRERDGARVAVGVVHRHFDRLLHVWPDARFVHLVRDGRDATRSAMAMGWARDGWHGSERWRHAEAVWDRLADRVPPDRRLEIHYEDLVADATAVLGRVCGFLGVTPAPGMLDYAANTDYDLPDASLAGQWRTRLAPADVALAEARIGGLLERRGYARSVPDAGPPTGARRAGLVARNRLYRWGRSVEAYGPVLWVAHAATRRLGPDALYRRVRLRMNAVDRSRLRRSW